MTSIIKSVFLFTLFPFVLQAQVFLSTMQTLPSLKRKTIETDHFRIVYPENLSLKAKYVASSLEEAFLPLQQSLKVDKAFDKIDIILQNQSAQSNGYVALAPFRSEWEALPTLSNSLGSTNWLLTLAIHEQRHMHQFLQYRKGFSKWMRILFGDFGTQLSIALSLPRWFFEGDAVVEETLLTKSGRGRVADFTKTLRSMIYENNLEDYTTVYNSSYEKNLPGPYELGYVLNLSMRADYEKDTFKNIVDNSVRNSFWPYKFEKNIRYYTHKDIDQFYYDAVKNNINLTKSADSKYLENTITTNTNDITSEISAHAYTKNSIVYYKRGYSETGGFYIFNLDSKDEELLFRTNDSQDNVRVRGTKMAYTDITIHPRYSLVNYSNIYIYDIRNRTKSKVTDDGQYLFAQLNYNQDKIASIYFNKKMQQFIKVLDLDGTELSSFKLDDTTTIRSLEWDMDETLYLVGINKDDNQTISKLNLKESSLELIKTFSSGVINDLKVTSDRSIVLSSDISGIDQIYLMDKSNLKRLTNAPVAARYPEVVNDTLYFSSYQRNGFKVKSTPLKVIDKLPNYKYSISKLVDSKSKPLNETLMSKDYNEKDFDKKNFRFHSWSYVSSILSQYDGIASISASDNLNEVNLTAGLINNFKEGATSYFTSLAYQKYWPIFFLNTQIGKRSVVIIDEEERDKFGKIKWDQNTVEAGVTIPFNFLNNAKAHSIEITNSMVYNKIDGKTYPENESDGELAGSAHTFNYSFQTLKPYTRLYSKYLFDFKSYFEESRTRTGSTDDAYLKYIGANVGLPGFSSTASFIFKYDHQEKSTDRFNLQDKAFFARDYSSLTSAKIDTASLNYSTALFYPDYNVFDVLYIKRIKTNLFYDYTVAENRELYTSYGLETIADLSPLRFSSFELGIGLRLTYLDRLKKTEASVFLESLLTSF